MTRLGLPGRLGAAAVVAGVCALGALGAVNSFTRVQEAVEPYLGSKSWTVPLGVDIGIAVFTGLDLLLARLGMRMAWLRLVPIAFIAATVFLNVVGETDPIGVVSHAVLPALWIVAVEAGGHVIRSRIGITTPTVRLDRIRWWRWLLAPWSTVRMFRRMVLTEQRSYGTAVRQELDRQLVRAGWIDRYGLVRWRWRAPRADRIRYRMGLLTPDRGDDTDVEHPKAHSNGGPDVSDLLAEGQRIARALTAEGRSVSGRALRERLRAGGRSVSNARANALAAQLR